MSAFQISLLTACMQAIVPDPDDELEALMLESFRTSLQQIREGRVHTVSEL